MGIYLTIFPLKEQRSIAENIIHVQDRLEFEQDYDLFAQLTDLTFMDNGYDPPRITTHALPLGSVVEFFREEGPEQTREDRYDKELTFVYAKDLMKLRLSEDSRQRMRAVMAFINALPVYMPIILYWH